MLLFFIFADKVLREISKETTVTGVWLKLENLYMTKSFNSILYLKRNLFGFKMQEEKSLEDDLDDFNKINLDLEHRIEVEDEDQVVILLSSLLKTYKSFRDTMKYGRESLIFEKVQTIVKSK